MGNPDIENDHFAQLFEYRRAQAEGSLAARMAQENGILPQPPTEEQTDDQAYWFSVRSRLWSLAEMTRKDSRQKTGRKRGRR